MYEKIRARKSVPELYEARLKEENVISEADAKKAREEYQEMLGAALEKVDSFKPKSEMLGGKWKDMVWPASKEAQPNPETGLPVDRLSEVGKASVALPDTFVRHVHTRRKLTTERPLSPEASYLVSTEGTGNQGRLCYGRGYGVWHSHARRV